MPEIFNERDRQEMQTLKNLIYNSDLHNQVKSYIANNTIKFYAFESTEELIKRYGGVLQFHLTIKQNIVNIVFMGWKDFHQYTKAIQCDISYSELGQQPIQTIKGKLSKLIRQLCAREWYPSDCKDAFGKRQQAGITPPVCVSETAASENADENEDERAGDSAKQSDDDFLSFAEGVLKEIGYKSPADGFWKDQTLNLNPWCNFVMKGKTLFVLEGDRSGIEDYNKGRKNKDTYIHLEVPPQPYIGDPKAAPIWLLPKNPSYSEMDIYDMVRCENDQNDLKRNILSSIRFKDEDGKRGYTKDEINLLLRYFFTSGSDSDESLSDRKKLMQNQLSFDSTDFYVLNEAFKTVQSREEIRKASGETVERKDDTKLGSYEWWDDYFFSGEKSICRLISDDFENEEDYRKNALNKFFVLESFPYHSRKFDKIIPWKLSEKYCHFWVMMVAYALANNKILLCRGEEIAKRVHEIAEKLECKDADEQQIFVGLSSGSFPVSTGNFVSYSAKPHFVKVVKGAMKQKEK